MYIWMPISLLHAPCGDNSKTECKEEEDVYAINTTGWNGRRAPQSSRLHDQTRENSSEGKFEQDIQQCCLCEDVLLAHDLHLWFFSFVPQHITGSCYYCKAEDHSVFGCTVLKTLPNEEQISIRRAWHIATVPCWNCLEIGHYKDECPNAGKGRSSAHNAQHPPMAILDVTDILKAPKPYSAYCHILADGFQKQNKPNIRVRVIETNLEKQGNHDQNNWNAERKSIFIVAD